jgi:organic hydroperoxide reductase OsmC/OhrA
MVETRDSGGHFEEVVLRPVITVGDHTMIDRAHALHDEAAALWFIASSVNFPVHHEPPHRRRMDTLG